MTPWCTVAGRQAAAIKLAVGAQRICGCMERTCKACAISRLRQLHRTRQWCYSASAATAGAQIASQALPRFGSSLRAPRWRLQAAPTRQQCVSSL